MEKFSFEIDDIDRPLDGGIPLPSIISLSYENLISYEVIVKQVVSSNNPVIYFTTHKNKDSVKKMFEMSSQIDDDVERRIIPLSLKNPVDDLKEQLNELEFDNCLIIVDSITSLEQKTPQKYKYALHTLQQATSQTDSCALLVGSDRTNQSNRDITISMSDVFFHVYEEISGGDDVETFLLVKKNRYGKAIESPFKIELSDTLSIDTSRAIA